MKNKEDTLTKHVDGKEIVLKHLNKLFWPNFTKGQMLSYYESISQIFLPYCKNRPVTAVIMPDGVDAFSFYLRVLPKHAPDWMDRVKYKPITVEHLDYLPIISDAASLLWFINDGAIELHLWGSTRPTLAKPDMAIFDLDAGEKVDFKQVCDVAMYIYEELQKRYMTAYVKTTGGRGMHIYVPIETAYTFLQVREWIKAVGAIVVKKDPAHIALPHGNTHTGKMVTIDDGQNVQTRNTVAPYSLRAHKDFPTVSMPLMWDEVQEARIKPTDFTPEIALARIQKLGDIFLGVLDHNQKMV